jgi:tetratricopeptide (TPR) repeat protein
MFSNCLCAFRVLCAGLTLSLISASGAARAQPARAQAALMKSCVNSKAPADEVIEGCTALIRRRHLSRGDMAVAYNNRGAAHGEMRDDDLAIADYTTAVRLDPKYADAYTNRGFAYGRERKPNHAIADFTAAIRIEPQDWRAHYGRGALLFEKAQYDLSLADFFGAVRGNPEYARAHAGAGRILFLHGSYADAADEFRTAMRLTPDSSYIGLAWAMTALRAEGSLEKDVTDSLGALDATKWPAPIVAFYRRKETAEALRAQARNVDQQCEAAFYIAEMALSRHDYAGGRRDLNRAVAACPHSFVEYRMARTELATGGRPRVVDGVDFDEVTFNSMRLHRGMHPGNATHPTETKLMEVASGRVGGRTLAVARYRYVPPATGYSESAETFLVQGGKAIWLATLGDFHYFNDSGPGVDPWILISFGGNSLLVDVWNSLTRCNPQGDWIATSYAVRDERLRALNRVVHHRVELAVDCGHVK